jgi:hypothetical protein
MLVASGAGLATFSKAYVSENRRNVAAKTRCLCACMMREEVMLAMQRFAITTLIQRRGKRL